PPNSSKTTSSDGFDKVWAALEPNVYWIGVNKQVTSSDSDDPGTLTSRALQLYASGKCDASLALSEKATELVVRNDGGQSAKFAEALVVQALCHKRLVHVAEAERLYRQAIDIYEKVGGSNNSDLAITLDNLAALYAEHGRLSEAERLRLRALEIFK